MKTVICSFMASILFFTASTEIKAADHKYTNIGPSSISIDTSILDQIASNRVTPDCAGTKDEAAARTIAWCEKNWSTNCHISSCWFNEAGQNSNLGWCCQAETLSPMF